MSASHPMPPLAQLFTEQVDGVLFVHLVGEVDLSNAEEVQARMMAPLVDASGLVLDLTATSYFDSTGVRMLFRVTEHLRGRSLPLRIVAPPGGTPVGYSSSPAFISASAWTTTSRRRARQSECLPGGTERFSVRRFRGGSVAGTPPAPAPPGTPTGDAGADFRARVALSILCPHRAPSFVRCDWRRVSPPGTGSCRRPPRRRTRPPLPPRWRARARSRRESRAPRTPPRPRRSRRGRSRW